MRNIMKKLFVCLLVTLFAFTIVSCKGDDDNYQYPSKTPTVTNPDQLFMSYQDLKVTNNQAYVKLLNTYGYDEVLNWLDEQINQSKLPQDNDEDFKDHRLGYESIIMKNGMNLLKQKDLILKLN